VSTEVKLNRSRAKTNVAIQLKQNTEALTNLTIIGYGTTKGEVIAGAVSSGITKYDSQNKSSSNSKESCFRIYPNPIPSNSTLRIEWNRKENGNYSFQLYNQSGQLVFKQDLYIDEKARVLSLDLPSVLPGSYFIRLTNRATEKSYTEKIIIQ
jgi:hypothetical protein